MFSRKLLIIAVIALVVTGVSAVAVVSNWPVTRDAVTQTLAHRFNREVTMRSFRLTYLPPGCIAEDVSFLHREHKDRPALITIRKLIIRGSYSGMLPFNKHVPFVEVAGLHVLVPPKSAGPAKSIMPLTDPKAGNTLPISDIDVEGADLEFISEKRDAKPYRISIQKLKLGNVGGPGQISYTASLENTEPPGEVHATGKFGPWDANEPGASPLSGSYTFGRANLGVFHGISGILSSQGKFTGTLGGVHCDSTASIAGFRVAGGSQSVDLSTAVHADVDAVNGDTFLRDVQSRFLNTVVLSSGSIAGQQADGKMVAVDLTVNDGRVDDLLRLFSDSARPSMTGRIGLHAKAQLPSEPAAFLERLAMEGDFGISGGRFTNPAVEAPLSRVSDSAHENKQPQNRDPQSVLSDLKGHVSIRGGVASLSNVSFGVSGGSARMKGTYNLLNHKVDMKGVLYTDGNLSEATSGFKALVLKVVTPFMKKKKTTIVPFTITGTSQNPNFALDFDGSRKL